MVAARVYTATTRLRGPARAEYRDDAGEPERRCQGRRRELAQAHLRGVAAEDFGLGAAVAVVLPPERGEVATHGVAAADLRDEDDRAAGVAQTVVELVVLAMLEVLREVADAVEDVAAVGAEGDGVDGAFAAGAEGGAADAEARRHRERDRLPGEGVALRRDRAADAVRAGRLERIDAAAEEIGRHGGVAIDAHDDVAACERQTDVQRGGREPARVRDLAQVECRLGGEARDDLRRRIARLAIEHDDLEAVAGIVLRGERVEAALDVALLVAHRHEHGDERSRHIASAAPRRAPGSRRTTAPRSSAMTPRVLSRARCLFTLSRVRPSSAARSRWFTAMRAPRTRLAGGDREARQQSPRDAGLDVEQADLGDLVVRGAQAIRELGEQRHGDRGVVIDPGAEGASRDVEGAHGRFGDGAGAAGMAIERGQLAEDVAGARGGGR